MNEIIEKMIRKKRRKMLKIMIILFALLMILIVISPMVSMFFGLMIAATGTYGLSPSMNMYRGFKSTALLSVVSKNSAENIYKIETEQLTKPSHYSGMLLVITLGISVFIVSLAVMGLNGKEFFDCKLNNLLMHCALSVSCALKRETFLVEDTFCVILSTNITSHDFLYELQAYI